MDFKQLECFVYVVEKKSFSKASDALFISQPAVTSNIQKLENWLKLKLINRHSKEISMTKEGKILYYYAKELLKLREKALSELSESGDSKFEVLSMNSSTIPAQSIVPGIVSEFKKQNPRLVLDLRVSSSRDVLDDLLSGRINIGFVGSEIQNKAFKSIDLFEDELLMICSNELSFPSSELVFEDLKDFDLFLREEGSATRKIFEDALLTSGKSLSFFRSVSEVQSSQAIKSMVHLSSGIGFVSSLDVENELKLKRLKSFKLKGMDLKRKFKMVYAKDRHFSPIETAFVAFVLSEFSLKSF